MAQYASQRKQHGADIGLQRFLILADTQGQTDLRQQIAGHIPFALPSGVTQLNGSTEIAQHLGALSGLITLDRMSKPLVHQTTDPDVVIVEVEGFGVDIPTGEPYEQRYVCVITTRNGRIVHYKDYWNPVVFLRAMQGSAKVDALIGAAH